MNDHEIVKLFFRRDEQALAETESKYGEYCHSIARRLSGSQEDAKECVLDAYLIAWNTIPPESPNNLRMYLGRIVRNLSVDRFRRSAAKKRNMGISLLLSELEECIPARDTVESVVEEQELSSCINTWLVELSLDDRTAFVSRYWFGESVKSLASRHKCTPAQMSQRLFRLRKSLKIFLEKEDICL